MGQKHRLKTPRPTWLCPLIASPLCSADPHCASFTNKPPPANYLSIQLALLAVCLLPLALALALTQLLPRSTIDWQFAYPTRPLWIRALTLAAATGPPAVICKHSKPLAPFHDSWLICSFYFTRSPAAGHASPPHPFDPTIILSTCAGSTQYILLLSTYTPLSFPIPCPSSLLTSSRATSLLPIRLPVS